MESIKCRESLKTIQEIHEWLNNCADIYNKSESGETILIDLSCLKWISPLGCTALLSSLWRLDKYFYLETIVPMDLAPVTYMERMDFFKLCPEDVKENFEEQLDMENYYRRNRNNKKDVLREIRMLTEYPEIASLYKELFSIMQKQGFDRNRASDIASIVSELGNNAKDHAKAPCFSCVQSYSNSLQIAICDSGIGIYNSIKSVVKGESSHDVISKAILTRVSRLQKDDPSRGKGLVDVKDRAFDWPKDSHFYVRTHNSDYQIKRDKLNLEDLGNYFFGTFFYLKLKI